MSRRPPDRAQLLDYARVFARELHAIAAPEAELGERIDYVIWGRKQGWQMVEAGELAELELVQLLIAHFDYECADRSGRSWDEFDAELRERFETELWSLLFGAPDSGPESG